MSAIQTAIQLNDMVTAPLQHICTALNMTISSFERVDSAADFGGIRDEVARAEVALREMAEATDRAEKEQRQYNDAVRASEGGIGMLAAKVRNLAGAYGAMQIAKMAVGTSDKVTQINARLNLIADGESVDELNDKIMASANRARSLYTSTADVVSKLALRAGNAFSDNDETIRFAETLNKMFVVAGASQQELSSASLQLTQALGSGVLRGEEFNAVYEAAPNVLQAIAAYMNIPIEESGKLRELASEGEITANIVKNAMLSAAQSVNEQFESMPYTWSQVGTMAINKLVEATQPLLSLISMVAQHWEALEPVFAGVAAAAITVAAGLGILAVANWIASGSAYALALALMSNPLTYIALAIGLVVYFVYKWIQSVGGLQIAWMICVNNIKYGADMAKFALVTAANGAQIGWLKFCYLCKSAIFGIIDFFGDAKANILLGLQALVNGAIDIINEFVGLLNKIPGVEIEMIEHVSFGALDAAHNEAEKQRRANELAGDSARITAEENASATQMQNMLNNAAASKAKRDAEIRQAQIDNAKNAGAAAKAKEEGKSAKETAKNTNKTANAASAIKDSLDITSENIKYIRDFAVERAVNRYTSTSIKVDMTNNNSISGDQDIDGIVNKLSSRIQETMNSSAEGEH